MGPGFFEDVAMVAANEYHLATMANGCTRFDAARGATGVRRSAIAAALIGALLAAGAAHAQNLVPGPDFDSASDFTNNWGNLGAGKTWSVLDFEGNPFSGSVSIDNTDPGSTGIAVFTPCFPVVEGDTYAFSAWQFTPSPPQGDGLARLLLQWRQSCPAGPFLGGDVIVDSEAIGDWTFLSKEAVAPAGAGGARLWLLSVKITAGGGYQIYFDHAYVPEPSAAAAACAAAACLAALRRRAA